MLRKMRLLPVLLCICSLLIAAAGCGGSGTASDGSGSSKGNDASESDKHDLEGQTVVIAAWADMAPKLGVSDGGDARYYALEWVKENYNCEVEYKVYPEATYFENFVQESLSGASYCDIALLHCWNYLSWINQDLVQPVTQYFTDADKEHWDLGLVQYNGGLWGVSPKGEQGGSLQSWLVYNTDMISDLNLESPQELAKRGEWTWAKFREYCSKATTLGKGYYGVHAADFGTGMAHTNEVLPYVYADGKFWNAYTHSSTKNNMIHLLEFMQQLKIQDKSMMNDISGGMVAIDEMLETFKSGKLMFSNATFNYCKTWKEEGMTNYAPITFPDGPDLKKKQNYVVGYSFYGIPQYTNYETDVLVDFLKDYFTTWDSSRGKAYYESGGKDAAIDNLYNTYFTKREDAQFMVDIAEKYETAATYMTGIDIGGIQIWNIYQPVLTGESTPASVLEATNDQIQEKLDAVLNAE